ncbi:MAG: hypothetical protein M1820_005518 [Bogoriella megaspora]|nr:MAG: hypothetical protein M1820_005518 [Bogoriella megaspora]
MDAKIQSQLTRVEQALNTLIDSITSYNPSPAAALDLVAADDELGEGLNELAEHQANYVRICQLREESKRLDDQTKDIMKTLAELRKELLATPATNFPESQNSVNYDELLAYAKRISRFTVPPTYRPPAPWDANAPTKETDPPASADPSAMIVDPPSPSAIYAGAANGTQEAAGEEQPGIGERDLPSHLKDWLDPYAKLAFEPWPTDDTIRSGGLATVQRLVEAGKDPLTDPRKEAEEAEARQKAEEEENARREKEEQERRLQYAAGANGHRGSRQEQSGGGFSLDLYESDEG